ncbi:hypothetical protein GVN16_11930 [Emticicia sp. CRIBPO]|nr:hypothetical protein [Emticicia sp. CRIBPO]NBA86477.1 hypothetical protein [Emticicia sp. CRIBPO]
MERQTTFDKAAYKPLVFKSYKILKKAVKYIFYLAIIYFAYEGFMAWE